MCQHHAWKWATEGASGTKECTLCGAIASRDGAWISPVKFTEGSEALREEYVASVTQQNEMLRQSHNRERALEEKLESAVDVIRKILCEVDRPGGRWVHLKRVIGITARTFLTTISKDKADAPLQTP